jgi:hypothetical protein
MNVFFEKSDLHAIVEDLRKAAEKHAVQDIVSFTVEGARLLITIRQFGTSQLMFDTIAREGGMECRLASEKIALMHRGMAESVKQRLGEVAREVGGKVLA